MSNQSEHLATRKLTDISSGQRLYLDFARVAAVNLVFIEHLSTINGYKFDYHFGMMGVVIFFLLSGFLIYTAAANRMQRPGEQLFPFLIDRTARIFSPLLPCILVVAMLNHFLELGEWGLTGVKRGALALFGNVTLLFDYPLFHVLSRLTGSELYRIKPYNTAEQFWTIPIEFWTYIVFAFFMFVFCRGERPNKSIAIPLFFVAFPVVLYNSFAGPGLALTLIWAMGAVAAYLWTKNHKDEKYNFYLGLAALAWGVTGGIGRVSKAGFIEFDLQYCLFIAMCTFGVFLVLTRVNFRENLFFKSLAFVSSYSYSLYLVHNTIIIVLQRYGPDNFAARAALSVIFSHITAITFYFCFERYHYNVAAWMKKVFIGNIKSKNTQGLAASPPSSS
jgi:peptidoglycan/LPS O-acetylase OafA/YrhL